MAKNYDLAGTLVVQGVVRDVTPNKKGNGFNVRVVGKYISAVADQTLIGTVGYLNRFFNTVAEAKFYADSCVGTTEKVFVTEDGNTAQELERKATGAMLMLASGKYTKEEAAAKNEERKGFVTANASARAAALAAAAGSAI